MYFSQYANVFQRDGSEHPTIWTKIERKHYQWGDPIILVDAIMDLV